MDQVSHGHSRRNHISREYRSWQEMRRRCLNSSRENYKWYGGRGITICEQWISFSAFLADMGPCPDKYTLDRFPDTNGNYEPQNCRWASRKEQVRNRRSNRPITINGETLLMVEWSERNGISKGTIINRLKIGWTAEEAISTPVRKHKEYKSRSNVAKL